jgi:hypothetical protein
VGACILTIWVTPHVSLLIGDFPDHLLRLLLKRTLTAADWKILGIFKSRKEGRKERGKEGRKERKEGGREGEKEGGTEKRREGGRRPGQKWILIIQPWGQMCHCPPCWSWSQNSSRHLWKASRPAPYVILLSPCHQQLGEPGWRDESSNKPTFLPG